MTTQRPVYEFDKYLELDHPDFDRAQQAHGEAHARLTVEIRQAKDRLGVAIANKSIRDREAAEVEIADLRREYDLLNEDYNAALKQAALRALDNSSLVLMTHKDNVRDLDVKLLEQLAIAWRILELRMESERKYNQHRQRLAVFSKKYPEGGKLLSAGRGVSVVFGAPLKVSDNEIMTTAWKLYTERFAQVRSPDIHRFIKGV